MVITKRQRVYATINRQGLDAIPWQFDLTSVVARRVAQELGVQDAGAALDDHIAYSGFNDAVCPSPAPGLVKDIWGVTWRREALDRNVGDWGGHMDYPLKEPILGDYRFPDPCAPGRLERIRNARAATPDRFICVCGRGLFEAAWALCGFENYLGYVAGEQAFVQELTEKLADYNCADVAQLKGLGIDGVRFGDDWGFQHTLMVRPELWRKLFKKSYARIFAAARGAGLVPMMHSCGNLTDIIPDLIECGLTVLHPLQPEAMDVARCHREFGKDIVFWGGLGSQSTIPFGTPDDVRREVRQRLQTFAGGGYILAPAGAAPTETPAANIIAIAQEARKQLLDH
jgi:uroporphyrinogen decarboxylase